MKQLFLLTAAAAVLVLSSCKKDYACTYKYQSLDTTVEGSASCSKCSKKDMDKFEDALKASGYTDVSCDKK